MAESKQVLRERIGDLAYEVTQNAATEYAFILKDENTRKVIIPRFDYSIPR